ncbi:MAG: 30S ribosomal protein S8 [Deltaproteobacteria bacterium RIFCSPHIGHO2_12_FULL_43_9]|nr:MAG: 30S ribosomal protein S8 [Deltaproteobacteria bacterium RIFCSPHIGHO2_12_FULL_43_9]
MITDGIADLLTRLRNGAKARHERIRVPHSTVKESIVKVLNRAGFVGDFSTAGDGVKKDLLVSIKYNDGGDSVILGSRRVSRPGCRRFVSADSIPPVASGLGISIISTPKGVMTNSEASEQRVGGELLCEIW